MREIFKPNTAVCGDCLDIMSGIDNESIDVVIVDPPFGTGTADWDKPPTDEMWREIRRVGKDMFAIFGYPRNLMEWAGYFSDLTLSGYIVWVHYNSPRVTRGLTGHHQDIAIWSTGIQRVRADKVRDPYSISKALEKFFCVPGGYNEKHNRLIKGYTEKFCRERGRRCGDVWVIPSPGMGFNAHLRSHPNEKPLLLMERLVLLLSESGQLVADFFCGSGSTLVAAARHNRQYFGCDIVPKYVSIAETRLTNPWVDYRSPQDSAIAYMDELF